MPVSKQIGIQFTAGMTIVFASIRLLLRLGKELILMCKLRREYFTDIYSYFEWADVPCYVLTISFAARIFTNCPCPSATEWQVGITGLFLSWIIFLKYVNKVPLVSNYVLMLWRIVLTFGKVAFSIGIPLILAFAWSFYMALYNPKESVSYMVEPPNNGRDQDPL